MQLKTSQEEEKSAKPVAAREKKDKLNADFGKHVWGKHTVALH